MKTSNAVKTRQNCQNSPQKFQSSNCTNPEIYLCGKKPTRSKIKLFLGKQKIKNKKDLSFKIWDWDYLSPNSTSTFAAKFRTTPWLLLQISSIHLNQWANSLLHHWICEWKCFGFIYSSTLTCPWIRSNFKDKVGKL